MKKKIERHTFFPQKDRNQIHKKKNLVNSLKKKWRRTKNWQDVREAKGTEVRQIG